MNANDTLAWIRLCRVDDIPPLGSRVVERDAGNLALFRTAQDRVFALLDRCPHKQGPLSQGIVHGESVTCPLHGWNIGLDDGQAKAPDQGCARRFPVRVEAGVVYVEGPPLRADARPPGGGTGGLAEPDPLCPGSGGALAPTVGDAQRNG
ncbi:Assimilatory nitrite reductase [NAD(P)H] small subunit [Pigmentiphaga humi]|uniref:Assimilatory nitrite reductase [NAD(P)H] small subunit n=1 Tax=Pigmentiphaga humi TaxID=2478468 RepID=A0A3P4B6H6_9BURK|nr:nitrite reductase small subunit NirD [Pigmentiphaga humi]VCU71126.1 Assimilatory nitrite reductase [NAD(P)H] small subunit [Pigmentiphaga humi]